MTQESGGRGTDPMQASECPYNTQYPNTPGAIQDADYSIKVGVQYYADCVREAGCESPQDMDKLKLSLQGYNYGMGISHGQSGNHGGYSEANALQFSQEQAAAHGGQVMAIQSMYPMCFGIILAGGLFAGLFGNGQLVTIAKSQLGERRRPEVLVVVGIHRATRMVCLFRVLVCRPGRTHSKRCGAKIFCLYGREELVSKPRKMAGAGSMPSRCDHLF